MFSTRLISLCCSMTQRATTAASGFGSTGRATASTKMAQSVFICGEVHRVSNDLMFRMRLACA